MTNTSTFADFVATLNETSFDNDHQSLWDSCKEIYYLVVNDPNNAFRMEPISAELTLVEASTGKRLIDALVPSKEKTVIKLYLCYKSIYLLNVTLDCSQFHKDYSWELIRESTGATINRGGDDILGCDLFSIASINRTSTTKCHQGGSRRSVCKKQPIRRLEDKTADEIEEKEDVGEDASARSLQPTSVPTFAESTVAGASHYYYYGDFKEEPMYVPIQIPSAQSTSAPGPSPHPVSNQFPSLDQAAMPFSFLPTSNGITLAERMPTLSGLLRQVPFGDTPNSGPSFQPVLSQPSVQTPNEATPPGLPFRDGDHDDNIHDAILDSHKAARLPASTPPPPSIMSPATSEPTPELPIFYPTTKAPSSRSAAFDNLFKADLRHFAYSAQFDVNIDICRPTSVGDSMCDAVNNNVACGETNQNWSLVAGVFRLGRRRLLYQYVRGVRWNWVHESCRERLRISC